MTRAERSALAGRLARAQDVVSRAEQIRDDTILALRDDGATLAEIGRVAGLPPVMVSKIIKRHAHL
jgi:hypothetical protein